MAHRGHTPSTFIVESARRHGDSDDDMLHALRFGTHHVRTADDMVMFIGPDQDGGLTEVGVVTWWGGELAPSPTP